MAGPAGLRGAGVRGGGALRLARPDDPGAWDPGQLEDQPVDVAHRHAAADLQHRAGHAGGASAG